MPQAPADRSAAPHDPRPIGVFDSGVGGLTVARALMDLLPDERIVYYGDTARGPYGPRDLGEVRRFTAQIVDDLARRDVKLVVAACNTATAAAVETDPLAFPVAVVGVIAPAVATALRATRNGRVGVIGTTGTIASGAYDRAVLAAGGDDVRLVSAACPRFVELVEAGRTTDSEVLDVAGDYLASLVAAEVDTLILGCTHYPLLTGVLSYVMGPDVVLVSSAEETARRVFARLVDERMLARRAAAPHRFVASGDGAAFARLAARFLGPRLSEVDVERAGPPAARVHVGRPG
ncbi:MAG: glutamate racemase [Actinobacteria bacterium]|nr:glutamate racemase [Actinomycetota bacterium]